MQQLAWSLQNTASSHGQKCLKLLSQVKNLYFYMKMQYFKYDRFYFPILLRAGTVTLL